MTAEVTWSGTSTLTLQIACPGGISTTRTQSSPLSLEIDDDHGEGDCTVTITAPSGLHSDVTYTLAVSPAP